MLLATRGEAWTTNDSYVVLIERSPMKEYKLKLMSTAAAAREELQPGTYFVPIDLPHRPVPEHHVAHFLDFIVDRVHDLVEVVPGASAA